MLEKLIYGSSRITSHAICFNQDKKSAIILDKNGESSSIKGTNHINICLFSITDRISKKELYIEWCPTNEMIGYFMAKPTQGSLFKHFIYLIMGFIPIKKDIKEIKEIDIKKKSM